MKSRCYFRWETSPVFTLINFIFSVMLLFDVISQAAFKHYQLLFLVFLMHSLNFLHDFVLLPISQHVHSLLSDLKVTNKVFASSSTDPPLQTRDVFFKALLSTVYVC